MAAATPAARAHAHAHDRRLVIWNLVRILPASTRVCRHTPPAGNDCGGRFWPGIHIVSWYIKGVVNKAGRWGRVARRHDAWAATHQMQGTRARAAHESRSSAYYSKRTRSAARAAPARPPVSPPTLCTPSASSASHAAPCTPADLQVQLRACPVGRSLTPKARPRLTVTQYFPAAFSRMCY